MIAPLLGIVGPPAIGKALNSVSGIVDRWGEGQRIRDERAHELKMAETKEGREYLLAVHEKESDGDESMFSRTMCRLYLMFGATMCIFILFSCFLQWEFGPEASDLSIKDPDEKGKTFSFFGISYNWGTGKIQHISPLGFAYLGYATLSFIITLTATNQRRAR